MVRPICFVLMPFGIKTSPSGMLIDFDAVYNQIIAPAIEKADLEPLRADEEKTGGIIHKPMFERLILCEYAVADLTTANANVFYELGVRHAVRPCSTILLFAEGIDRLPFDVAPLRGLPYRLTQQGTPEAASVYIKTLTDRFLEARKSATDSPIYQLVEDYPEVDHTKTDVFRERVAYSQKIKTQLARGRKGGPDAVREIEKELGRIEDCESGVVIDLFLSYRAVEAWKDMINLVGKMSPPLAVTALVQEQLGFALNRDGQGEEAERILLDLIYRRGPSSETYGILGRVYKDRWEEAQNAGQAFLAAGLLDKAIEAYLNGFEADWRDAYPGINAATLMEVKSPPDPLREKVIPVVTYAVERRIKSGMADYWDYATLLELAVLSKKEKEAVSVLGHVLSNVREAWEPKTTARNLRLIRETRQRRGENVLWAITIEEELENRSKI